MQNNHTTVLRSLIFKDVKTFANLYFIVHPNITGVSVGCNQIQIRNIQAMVIFCNNGELEKCESIIIGDMPSLSTRRCLLIIFSTTAPPPLPVGPACVWPVSFFIPFVDSHSTAIAPLAIDPLVWRCQCKQPSLSYR